MKTITSFISEKLNLNNDSKIAKRYNFAPKNRSEFSSLIDKLIKERGPNANLNDIDTSNIAAMDFLFYGGEKGKFDGDISKWEMKNVVSMEAMFYCCAFTGDHGDISNWNVSECKNFAAMFERSGFKGNIEKWKNKIQDGADMEGMFHACPLENKEPSWYDKHYNQALWNI